MKQSIGRFLVALAGLTLCGGEVARAGDILPPCGRGLPGSTYQLWNFSNNANPASPDAVTNTNGAPTAQVVLGTGAESWINSNFLFGTNQGIWDLGRFGTMTLSIPGVPASSGWKYVALQVQQVLGGGTPVTGLASVFVSGATLVSSQLATNNPGNFGANWVVGQTLWRLDPDPGGPATVVITATTNGSAIDQVIADAWVANGDNGDQFQPCWRGGAGTTYQNWSFHTSVGTAVPPEQGNNPATATINLGLGGLGWYDFEPGVGCKQGFWDLGNGGAIQATVPGAAGTPTSYKYVQVQVVRYADGFVFATPPSVAVTAGTGTITQMGGITSLPWTTGANGQWYVDKTVWRVTPDTGPVTVTVTAPAFGAWVDQLVVDTISLDPVCPSNQVLYADSGICGKTNVTWTLPAPDGCVITNATSTPPSGSTFPVGVSIVTNRFFDSLGGQQVCTFTVTVTDNQLPVITTCPPDLVLTNNPLICGAVATFAAFAEDNCTVTNLAYSHASGSTFPLGLTTVNVVATDAAGNNSATCSFTVRVVDASGDALAPCWRGSPLTTFQQWVFSTSDDTPAPELVSNAGTPSATVTLGSGGLGWYDQESGLPCRQGFWDLGAGGTIVGAVPTPAGSAAASQYVRVQVVYLTGGLVFPNPPQVSVVLGTNAVTAVGTPETSVLSVVNAGTWMVQKTVWKVVPAGGTATVTVTGAAGGAFIDQVVVDTLVVEPVACPDNLVANADSGLCDKTNVTWAALPTVDGCLIKSATDSPASGSTFPVGVTTVTRTIVDAENQTNTCTFTVTILDVEPPVISPVAATQAQPYLGTVNVAGCANPAVQGVVNLTVTVTDPCAVAVPVLALTNGSNGELASFVNQAPAGTYHYTWTVSDTTAPGTWNVTVTATDGANASTATTTVCVNTTQIAGQVELQGFLGTGTVPPHSRAVTFVATETTPSITNILKSWTVPLTNTSGAVFNYTLTDVPPDTTHLSAKTAWNLRRKLPVSFTGPNGTANFTGAALLKGGDLDGSNLIDAVDNGLLRDNYDTANVADLDGNGVVNAVDNGILRDNYGQTGDSP